MRSAGLAPPVTTRVATRDVTLLLDPVAAPSPLREFVPAALKGFVVLGQEPWQWAGVILVALAAYLVGRLVGSLANSLASFFVRRTDSTVDDALVEAGRRPLRLALATLAFSEGTEWLVLTARFYVLIRHVCFTLLLFALAWFVVGALRVGADWAEKRVAIGDDELKTRAVRTQIILLRRIATAALIVISIAIFLLQFELVRSVGISLLASAGILGVVLGFALQKSLAGIIAGIQVSLTQPFRLGDVVIVEGEFGTVEQINLT